MSALPVEGIRPMLRLPTVLSPAPPRLRRSTVPEHEPRPAARVIAQPEPGPLGHVQGTLALVMPDGDRASAIAGVGDASDPDDDQPPLPEPRVWAATFVQAAMEVAGGMRSPGQLVRWTTPEVHTLLQRRGALTARARRSTTQLIVKPRLRAMNSCVPRAGVCEVGAVVAEAERVRAVAFRMEGVHGRWRVTELEIG